MSEKFNLQAVAGGHQGRFLLNDNGNILCMDNPEGGRLPVVFDSEADAKWFMALAQDAGDIPMDGITADTAVMAADQMDAGAIPAAVYVITKA